MRLKTWEVETIKEVIAQIDPKAKVYLFGSRVDDRKRGGDIDLLIDSKVIGIKELLRIKTKLFLKLGDRSVDIVLKRDNPFVRHIEREAIKL